MKLCKDCLEQCVVELVANEWVVLFTLDGCTTLANGYTRSQMYELIDTMKATQINEILRKLEFLELIKSNNSKKNTVYCMTADGHYIMSKYLDRKED